MTNPYRDMCAELLKALKSWSPHGGGPLEYWEAEEEAGLIARAENALAQAEPEGSKPVVDYSRVPEIATEAQIRSAAQYLVKKRNCDGDLIPAIEYAIARWGRPTLQPVAVSERLPGPEDCDEQGRCWWLGEGADIIDWTLDAEGYYYLFALGLYGAKFWLPAQALPIPETP